jgi:hypothetical protein
MLIGFPADSTYMWARMGRCRRLILSKDLHGEDSWIGLGVAECHVLLIMGLQDGLIYGNKGSWTLGCCDRDVTLGRLSSRLE